MGTNMETYHLTVQETIRYFFFQTCVYSMIYYGFCAHIEAILGKEIGGDKVSKVSVILITVSCLLSMTVGKRGGIYVCAGLFALLAILGVVVCFQEASLYGQSPR